MMLPPLSIQKWIDENRHLLKPPVSNKVIWKDHEFIVMVVGGPNQRTDFHVNQGEEFFYQIEGEMFLRVQENGKIREIPIRAGEIFLLPANTPHSPQRMENSIGLVIERRRHKEEVDALEWYCSRCHTQLYREEFHLTDIETQFPAVFQRYYSSPHVQCQSCGHTNGKIWN